MRSYFGRRHIDRAGQIRQGRLGRKVFYHYAGKLVRRGLFSPSAHLHYPRYRIFAGHTPNSPCGNSIGGLLFLLSGLGLVDLVFKNKGGIIGHYVSCPLISLVDVYASAQRF